MSDCQLIFCVLLSIQFGAVVDGARGTFSQSDDDKFQMLIAGGIVPEHGVFVRNLVSIRTLNYISFHGDNHFCTGVITSSRTILTAAHCVTDNHKSIMHPRGLMVIFGALKRLERYNEDESRRVHKIVVHPHYRRYEINDVAILQLTTVIPANLRHVKPVIKRKRLAVTEGMKCVTMGWGQVYPHGPYADEVMFLDVIIRPPQHCKKQKYFKKEGNICTEPINEGQVCPGDLGGPLICQSYMAGIIGASMGCQGINSIKFINFSYVEDWVEKTVLALSANRCKISLLFYFPFVTHIIF
ncbi:chymotrypsin-2-like [Drosophila albomicans]|uniref:trypsin n=1 Tax=Drosophila albomicans TaxID=7291 RepID=A0A6P8WZM6_DROAB|nr:chymotrypsin-2-like [Drosophila albomicans]